MTLLIAIATVGMTANAMMVFGQTSIVGTWTFTAFIKDQQVSGTVTYSPGGTYQVTLAGNGGSLSGTYRAGGSTLTECPTGIGCLTFSLSNVTPNSFDAQDAAGTIYHFSRVG